MPIPTERTDPGTTSRRPPTALQLALTIVTAGIAVASAMLALVAPAQASLRADPAGAFVYDVADSIGQGPAELGEVAEPFDQVPDEGSSPYPGMGEDLMRSGLPGVMRAGPPAITRNEPPAVRLAAEPFTASGTFRPASWVNPHSPLMPMPVQGDWIVTCGYRCGRHTEQHLSTFALDIVRQDGKTAGQAVRSPVDGSVIAVVESSVAVCGGRPILGREAGAVIIIDFKASGGAAHRLRMVHLDADTVPEVLRNATRAVPVKAGSYLGSLATIQGCAHLHFNLTRLDGLREVPQLMVIDGVPLKDCGGLNCWAGAVIRSRYR
jgi:hypothetical protein